MQSDEIAHTCWWVINGGELLSALKRVANGDDPDLAYVELWANSTSEEGGDDV